MTGKNSTQPSALSIWPRSRVVDPAPEQSCSSPIKFPSQERSFAHNVKGLNAEC